MTAGVQQATTLRNTWGDAITTAVGNGGKVKIYDGTKPASVATALSGNTLGVTLICGTPFAPATASGVLSPTLPASVNAVATITATFYRVTTSADVVILQDDVVSAGTGLILNPSSNIITSGQPVIPTSWTYTMPGA